MQTFQFPWTQQPPDGTAVDWSNPITKGLKWLFPVTSNNQSEVISGDRLVLNVNAAYETAYLDSLVSKLDGSSHISYQTIDISGWTELTVVAWVNHDSSGSNEHTVISNWDNDVTNAAFLFRLEPSDDTIEFFVVEQTNTQTGGTLGGTITPNKWTHIAAIYDQVGEGNLRALVNGVRTGTEISTAGTALDGSVNDTDVLYIGSSPHGSGDELTGSVYGAMIFNRALPDHEIASLYQDPLLIYEPIVTPVAIEASAPSTTIPVPTGPLR